MLQELHYMLVYSIQDTGSNLKKVKPPRAYNGRSRLEQAQRTRENVLEIARQAFLERGYAGTTIAAVASAAGVSVETIHKAFGGKSGLVRAIYERGLAGRGSRPATERSDAMSSSLAHGHSIARAWGRLTAEVSPMVSPILLLVRQGAAADEQLAELWRDAEAERLTRMTLNARKLAERGFLKVDLSIERAGEIMWTYTSAELYELLVVRCNWSAQQFGDFVGDALAAAVIEDSA